MPTAAIAFLLLLGASMVTGLAITPASAAEAPLKANPAPENVDDTEPTDIVVTARGREQRLLDVPVAVSVVPGSDLERADLRSLQDVTARLPNVHINSGTNTDVLVVRGVGSGANVGFEQAVGTFVDGVCRGRSRATRAALFRSRTAARRENSRQGKGAGSYRKSRTRDLLKAQKRLPSFVSTPDFSGSQGHRERRL